MRIVVFVLLLCLLVACGLGAITQTNQTQRFTVVMSIDGQTVAPRIITLTITDKNGNPAQVDSVILAPVMREMGMASPEMTATALGNGRYEIKGQPFSMLGVWELAFRISAAGQEDTTSFMVEIK
jgi:hypothetical protein